MFDRGGLYVEVFPAATKLWRLKYRFDGKEKRLAFGAYPSVSLAQARKRREEARELQPLTGQRVHVFPGRDPKKAMGDTALNAALPRMGYGTKTEITGHGFLFARATLVACAARWREQRHLEAARH